MTGFFLWIIF